METQFTIAINFISSKNVEEEHVMQSSCDNVKFTLIMIQMKLFMNFLSRFVHKCFQYAATES